MPAELDVSTSLLYVSGGRLLPEEPPGYACLAPPRKTARGREHDTLLLCLGLKGREAVPPERYEALLTLAGGTFYGLPGSVTSALRQAIAAVNQRLLDDNRTAGTAPLQGGLIAAVARGVDFYAVQAGPGLLLVAREAGHERFPQASTRPLGLSNSPEVLYFHTTVDAGEFVCLSSAPARGWTDIALVGLGNLGTLEAVAGRLKETAGTEAAALVGRFDGEASVAQPAAEGPAVSRPAPAPPPLPRAPAPARAAQRPPTPVASTSPPPARSGPRPGGLADFFRLGRRASPAREREPAAVASAADPAATRAEAPAVTWSKPRIAGPNAADAYEAASAPAPAQDLPPFLRDATAAEPVPQQLPLERPLESPAAPRRAPAASARRGVRAVARAITVTVAEAIRGLRLMLGRMLPEGTLQKEGLFTVPTSVQIGIAILIPVVVVGISVWLYLESGRAEQYTAALSEAQLEVAKGRVAPDDAAARPHWEAALNWLSQAEALRPAQNDVAVLRAEAQSHLDAMDWVTRLDYRPLLLGGLGRDAHIKQLLLAGGDVYALEETHNRVYRLMPSASGQGYTIDEDFNCAGGQPVRDLNVGQLVDIALVNGATTLAGDAVLPVGGTVVVAFDSLGALMYCAPGVAQPYASYLAAPDTGWIRPLSLEMYTDRLYVLDPGASDIWQYTSSAGAFTQAPARYFTAVSYDFADVVDFAIASGDVYLLHRDGTVSSCTRASPGAAPTCVETAQFTDNRPGSAGLTNSLAGLDAPLLVTFDPPPEPSLYLLDGQTSALYQLSLKLSLVRQFRPYFPLPAPISAVAFDPAKRFYAAAGDNVYVAERP
jgi:hypothetical protein